MDLSEKVESIGGGGSAYAAGGFGIGLFLMAIFLVVLFSLFCRGGQERLEPREGCADKLTWSRYANYVDPEIMRNHIDQCRDTGEIRKDIATENGQILASIDRQTRDIQLTQERTTNNIILGQAAIAREQRSAARSPTGRGLRTAVALSGLSSSSVLRTLKLVRGKNAAA